MKMRKQKLLSMMLCAALTVTSIVSEGFSVSASELQPGQQMTAEEDTETGNVIPETEAPEDETEGNLSTEETAGTENEKTEGPETEAEETEEPETTPEEAEDETQTQQEESGIKDTESATEVQKEDSEAEEIEEEESEMVNETETVPQQETVEEELIGVYQFGDAPSEGDSVSGFSLDNAADVNLSEIEEYLYREMLGHKETIDVQDYNMGMDEWNGIVQGVLNENQDLYYVNKGINYSFSSGSTSVSRIALTYNDSLDDDAFQKATKEALSAINGKMSALEKAIALHDYLALNCEYDEENKENNTIPDTSYSAYGALVNRMAVCQGYALAYKYLLNRAGIDCYMVTSDKMNHAWNLVKLDGKYYQVDVTWDDPVWDLVGRVRHQYMFRSDKAFMDECEHQDWYVTEGSKVVDYQATDASYDNAFWLESGSPLVMVGADCYYIAYDKQKGTGILNKAAMSDTTEAGTAICDIGAWPVWNENKYWTNAYSGLFQVNGRLYYNDRMSIYSIALDDMGDGVDKRTEFTADTTDGYIYGSAFCQGKVLYSLHQSPNFSSGETVLTADITLESGDGSVGEATGNEPGGDIASGSYEDIAWVIDADGKLTVTGTGEFGPLTADKDSNREVPWLENSDSIKSAEINVIGMTDASYMFYGCSALKSVDLSGLDTGNVTDMSCMFSYCGNLESVDLSGFDTGNVEYIRNMFGGCGGLTTVDLSSFNLSNVEITDDYGISDMLLDCDALTTIYIPCNLPGQIILPSGDWYKPDGTKITELPLNLNCSMMITKDKALAIGESYMDDGLATEAAITVKQEYTVTFELNGHGTPIKPLTGIVSGSRISMPPVPTEKDWEFRGWYKDASYKEKWDFEKDTVEKNITLYAYWYSSVYIQSGGLVIQRIPNLSYTGSELKPKVTVYYQTDDGQQKRLNAGKDYTVKYFNNIQADTEKEKTLGGTGMTEKDSSNGFTKNLAYVVITCKGNYKGTVYQNFHIDAASIKGSGNSIAKGFTLKYTEQLAKSDKPLKPFTSLKYKQAMKAGKDYTVALTAKEAYNAKRIKLTEGSVIDGKSVIPSIPAGYYGTFLLTVTGIGNYTGTVTKDIYVAGKDYLIKNASIVIGKNQKSMKYTGEKITLTPGWYDVSEWKYYAIDENKNHVREEKKNIFTVKIGQEYLLYGQDFDVSYSNNLAVGTATMTIKGIGDYVGSKKVTFRIMGTAFNAKNISVDNLKSSMVYTGVALTQDKDTVELTDISGRKSVKLGYGKDYTISYKNNVKAGTATVIFTGKPESGYSGSFKKTFNITPVGLKNKVSCSAADSLSDRVTEVSGDAGSSGNMQFDGKVIYTKEGAKISGRVMLTDKTTNSVLKEGTDYTVSYSGNKRATTADSLAVMTITGKGNYKGSIKVYFPIEKADLSDNTNLKVTAAEISYNPKKAGNFRYRPQIRITDKNKALSAKDFKVVEYVNCSQEEVTSYLEAQADGTAIADERPYAVVEAREGSNYIGEIEVDLTIYQKKLSANNLYIVVSQEPEQITYTGRQVTPEVTVYYGNAKAVRKAKAAKETEDSDLTDPDGEYRLRELTMKEYGVGDYTLTYGTNIAAGKDKGSITIRGAGMYSGKVTVKFKILGKEIHN